MAKAYAYIRWSTDKQAEGDSLVRQTTGLDGFTSKYPQVEIKRSYVDEGVSSFSGKNRLTGELAQMIQDISTGQIQPGDYIVCESIDRLTREGWEVATDLIRGFVKKGIHLFTTFDNRLYTSSRIEDFLMIGLIAERAKNESETKSIRIKEAWKRRTANKEKTLFKHIAPFGLKVVDGAYQVDKKAQDEIKELLEIMATSGVNKACSVVNNYSTYKWNKAKAHALITKKWVLGIHSRTTNLYSDVMDSGEVIGRRRRQVITEQIEGFYPKVVSEALFYRAVMGMEGRSFQKNAGRRSTNFSNIFSKTIFCSTCEQPLFYQQAKNPSLSKNDYVRILHCPICKWQMPFDVAFYEFLYFVRMSGLGSTDTGDYAGGIGGTLTGILSSQKQRSGMDVEKAEELFYRAIEDEKALGKQMESMDIFPIPKLIIDKVKQVSLKVAQTKRDFEEAKAKVDQEVELNDFIAKMESEKGRLELNSIIKGLDIRIMFQFHKQEGEGWIEVKKVDDENGNHGKEKGIWYREFQYKKTNNGSRAKEMVEKFGFDVIDVMEGRAYELPKESLEA